MVHDTMNQNSALCDTSTIDMAKLFVKATKNIRYC